MLQATIDGLGLNLCYQTDVKSTNAGGIFVLFIHGHITLIILRPSLGSTLYLAGRQHGAHAIQLHARAVHNQLRFVGRHTLALMLAAGTALHTQV